MKIAVIKPSMFGEQAKDAMPPLLFAILRPLTSEDVDLYFIDENIEIIPDNLSCDAVAITLDTFTARRGYLLADKFRQRGIPVILGGIHVTLCAKEAKEHADAIVIGEAEDTWGKVISDLKADQLQSHYISKNNINLEEVQYDYSIFKGKKYNPIWPVQFSRGCRFSCDFCSIHALHGNTLRTRSALAVANTIKQLPNQLIFFTDDNLFADLKQLDELLQALKPLKRRWVCQISIDAARDVALLQRLRQSGCVMLIIGFESLNAESLRQMNKSANLLADYELVIENIKRVGLMIYGTFVIGYDADTYETASQLMVFAKKHRFAIANFNPLIPTPGTKLYTRLEENQRLLYDRWWDDETYHYGDTAFQPQGMSPEQLAQSCLKARFTFYSLKGIMARFNRVNVSRWFYIWAFLLANIISSVSIHQKQGRTLGE